LVVGFVLLSIVFYATRPQDTLQELTNSSEAPDYMITFVLFMVYWCVMVEKRKLSLNILYHGLAIQLLMPVNERLHQHHNVG
jgi:hypothetical protein